MADIQITAYTDPYCTWCWGSEPALTKLRALYGAAVSLRFVMGGLVQDIRQFRDVANGIGGEHWYREVAEHWRIAAQRHGMPVDVQVWYDIKDEWRSTYPASIYFKAVEIVAPELATRYLRHLREGAAAERRPIHRIEVAAAIADEVGVDVARFHQVVEDGQAHAAFAKNRGECASRRIHGFPTLILNNASGEELALSGFSSFQSIHRSILKLAGDGFPSPRSLDIEKDLFHLMELNGSITAREVAEAFDRVPSDAEALLDTAAANNLLERVECGNGALYRPVSAKCADCACLG